MAASYIPGTNVQAEILSPATPGGFVSLFLAKGETGNHTGSVNAGTSNPGSVFAVGLGGINGAFASSLGKAGQNTNAYQAIHNNLYIKAGTGLTASQNKFGPNDPVCFSLIQKPAASFNLPQYDGIVFIDVFNNTQLPNGNPLNTAMIYLVPPNNNGNYPDNAAFLAAVKATNITLVEALAAYNTTFAAPGNASGLQQISTVRMCLFSSGIYKGNETADNVAAANLAGLEAGLTANVNSGITLVQFEFSNVIL